MIKLGMSYLLGGCIAFAIDVPIIVGTIRHSNNWLIVTLSFFTIGITSVIGAEIGLFIHDWVTKDD